MKKIKLEDVKSAINFEEEDELDEIVDMLGTEVVLNELIQYLDVDTVVDFIDWIKRNYDL